MKKATILLAALIVLIPSLAYSDMLTVRLGYYMPQALSDLGAHPDSLWAIELSQMSFQKSDFRGSILGAGYEFFLTPQLSFAISVDFYDKENGGYYVNWVSNTLTNGDFAFPAQSYNGSDILHTFHVSMVPVQFSLKVTPLGLKARVIPYVGGGIGAYFVSASVWGSIVDFSQPYTYTDPVLGDVSVYPVVGADAHETRLVLGGHAFAGVMIPIGYRMTIEAEARYHYVTVNFHEAFPSPEYEKFDLSGLSLSIGFNYWF
jgi:hypothetical protein